MKRMAFALASILSATGLAHSANLTGDQIQAALVGKNLTFTMSGAGKNEAFYSTDGTAKITMGGKADTGTWRVKGAQLCTKWKVIRAGKESCWSVVSEGDGKYKTSTGVMITAE